ncbi:MAG: hypothetical protein WKG07_30295 [Hymenobacter sp.]
MLVPDPARRVMLRFYAHAERRGRPRQPDGLPQPGTRYRYLVRPPAGQPAGGTPGV